MQLETKRGKWSKRWLEARGGQIFLSKNEKGKDEMQINALFSDTYVPVRGYASAPRQYVIALKRLEAAATFENASEHIVYLCAEDTTGWKLATACYASRSFSMAATNDTIKRAAAAAHRPPPPSGSSRAPSRAPSMARPHAHAHSHTSGHAPASHSHATQATPHTTLLSFAPSETPTSPTTRANGQGPLVNLKGSSPFTGRGLLGRK